MGVAVAVADLGSLRRLCCTQHAWALRGAGATGVLAGGASIDRPAGLIAAGSPGRSPGLRLPRRPRRHVRPPATPSTPTTAPPSTPPPARSAETRDPLSLDQMVHPRRVRRPTLSHHTVHAMVTRLSANSQGRSNHRPKRIRRILYRRGHLDVLRRRMLEAPCAPSPRPRESRRQVGRIDGQRRSADKSQRRRSIPPCTHWVNRMLRTSDGCLSLPLGAASNRSACDPSRPFFGICTSSRGS
jgi:hypothetical protein